MVCPQSCPQGVDSRVDKTSEAPTLTSRGGVPQVLGSINLPDLGVSATPCRERLVMMGGSPRRALSRVCPGP